MSVLEICISVLEDAHNLSEEQLQEQIDCMKLRLKWSALETGFAREQMLNVYESLVRRKVMMEHNLINHKNEV